MLKFYTALTIQALGPWLMVLLALAHIRGIVMKLLLIPPLTVLAYFAYTHAHLCWAKGECSWSKQEFMQASFCILRVDLCASLLEGTSSIHVDAMRRDAELLARQQAEDDRAIERLLERLVSIRAQHETVERRIKRDKQIVGRYPCWNSLGVNPLTCETITMNPIPGHMVLLNHLLGEGELSIIQNQALDLVAKHRYLEAVVMFRRTYPLAQAHLKHIVLKNVGLTYMLGKEFQKSLEVLRELVRLYPQSTSATEAQALIRTIEQALPYVE